MKFDVQFYETENGEHPVEDFVFSLDEKMQAKERRKKYMQREDING